MELTAVSWSLLEAAWPARASGSRARTAMNAPAAQPFRVRATPATVVATAATSELMMPERKVSSVQTKAWNCGRNCGLDSGVLAKSAKPRTTPPRPAATHTMPDHIARRPAWSIAAGVFRPGSRRAPTTSRPMVSDAATSWTTRSSGRPHRTTAPTSTSPATEGVAAPPMTTATVLASSAMTTTARTGTPATGTGGVAAGLEDLARAAGTGAVAMGSSVRTVAGRHCPGTDDRLDGGEPMVVWCMQVRVS